MIEFAGRGFRSAAQATLLVLTTAAFAGAAELAAVGPADRLIPGASSSFGFGVGKLSGASVGDARVDDPVASRVAQAPGAPTTTGPVTSTPDAEGQSASDLNRKLTNPVSDIWAISNQFNNFKLANGHWNNNWNFQPVLPVSLTKDWNLITRPDRKSVV